MEGELKTTALPVRIRDEQVDEEVYFGPIITVLPSVIKFQNGLYRN